MTKSSTGPTNWAWMPRQLAEKYISEFHRDMDALNVMRADHEPKVTEHIAEIIDIVQRLVEKGLPTGRR